MSNLKPNHLKTLGRTSLAIALAMGLAGVAYGQSTAGSVFGQVPAAAAGETVVATSKTGGITRSSAVDADGHYSIGSLPVGTYTISLERDGTVVSSRDVTVLVGRGSEVSFASGAGAENAQNLEGLTVSASALPTIDVSGVDSRTVITAEQLSKLPLSRTAEDIALLAPGVIQGSSDFTGPTGNRLASFGGAGVSENAYYINGMNVTDPLQGLGGITLPYGAIEQQEILIGGTGAAYGRSDGGVINQIGKRGTNEWHFGAQILYTPTWGRGTPRSTYYKDAFPNNEAAGSLYQYRGDNKGWAAVESAYVGGPLIKDKLFLFASAEGERSSDTYVGVNSSAAQVSNRNFHDPKWYAKLDWNINDSNILELTGASTKHQYDANNYEYDYDTYTRGDYVSAATATKTSASMWIAKYTGYITDNLTISAQYGKQKTDLFQEAGNFDPDLIPILGSTAQNPDILNGRPPITNATKVVQVADPEHQTKGANYRFDVTYTLGDHTLTAGIDNQRTQDLNDGVQMASTVGYAWQYGRTGTPGSEISEGQVDAPDSYPGGAGGYYVDKYIQTTGASIEVEQRAQYIEDTWQINDRWLVKLGLRNDQFTNYNSDGEAYINQHTPQWAPRLGFSWDVLGDSSFKVYGNAGRYYLALPTSVALRGASGSLYTKTYYTYTGIDPATGYPTGLTPINTANGPEVPFSENLEYGQAPDARTVTSKSLKAQYSDEYILGFDKQLNDSWTYGAKATYRSLRNSIDDTCYIELFEQEATAQGADTAGLRGCYFFNPGRSADFQLPDGNGGYSDVHISNEAFGFPQVKRKYYALDLYLEHPFDGKWWGKVSYTYSKDYGNNEGQVKSDIGQDDIGATQDWDYPQLMQYASGRLPNDHQHQLKAYGTYQINPEFNVSANIQVLSGAPSSCNGAYGPDQTYPAYGGNYYHWCNGQPAPMGSAGDTPWTHILSLNAEYRPAFADHKLAFNVNVYNVFNEQKATRYEPDYSEIYRLNNSYETPRYIRFGATYDF